MDNIKIHFISNYLPEQCARVELKNGRFVDVIKGCYFDPHVSLIIKDKKIESMPGLTGEVNNFEPDFTIDLKGRTVIPGLFNTHSHIQLVTPALLLGMKDMPLMKKFKDQQVEKSMADCLARGVTNVRDALTEDLRLNRNLRNRITNNKLPGPRIYQSVLVSPMGGTFAPKHGPLDLLMFNMIGMPTMDYESPDSGIVVFPPGASARVVRDAVNRAIDERGAEYIKIYDQCEKKLTYKPGAEIMNYEELEAACDQSRLRGIKSTMHHLSVNSFRQGIRAGISSLAHIPFDSKLTEEDIKLFVESECMIEPTLSLAYYFCWNFKDNPFYNHHMLRELTNYRNSTYASIGENYWIKELINTYTGGMKKANTNNMKMFGMIDMSYVYKYYSGIVPYGMENTRILYENGAKDRIGCGNDSGASHCSQASIQTELDMFNLCLNNEDSNTLKGAEALRIATINSAKAMGLEDKFGSITPGKTADLVILDGDPLKDYHLIGSRAAALFMDGKLVINNCNLNYE